MEDGGWRGGGGNVWMGGFWGVGLGVEGVKRGSQRKGLRVLGFWTCGG